MPKKSSKNKKELYKPVVNGRASVCTWTLTFSFKTKEQIKKFIDLLFDRWNNVPDLQIQEQWEESMEVYYVTINNYSWANNLIDIAQMLKEVDYDDGCNEE